MAAKPSDGVHEFLLVAFKKEIGPDRQLAIMEALGHHLLSCEGLIEREFFRSEDGWWVEHAVWASRADLETSAGIEADVAVARLFDCFDTRTVAYARGERVDPGRVEAAVS